MATFIGLIMNSKCQQTLISFPKLIYISYHTFVGIHSLLHASAKVLEYNLCRL